MNIIIYEDEGYKNFLPLTWTRPVYDLRCGINTLVEKIIRQYPKARVDFSCRYYLPGPKIMKFEKGLFINGRVLAGSRFAKEIPLRGKDEVFYSGDEIVAIRAVSKDFEEVRKKARSKRVNVRVLKYPWELIIENSAQIAADRKYLRGKGRGKRDKGVVVYNPKDVIIEAGAVVAANSVIDARQGPVYIGKGTIVRPCTYLGGPLSIGPNCRIGGEVEACIFRGFSNKHHDGFIGHSYVGEWVNLGAMTTNSDLKNNYGPVRVSLHEKEYDTGLIKLGCFVGDHTKLGIGTLIPTGAVIGSFVNFAGGGMMPKFVGDFRWLTVDSDEKYDLQKAINTAKTVMKRRRVRMSKPYEQVIRSYHGQICGSN